MEVWVTNYLIKLGLTVSLALLVSFRAGRLWSWQLTAQNYEDKIYDLACLTLREEIANKLQNAFDLHWGMPEGRHVRFPGSLDINLIAGHIHNCAHDVNILKEIHLDLVNQGLQSDYFRQALEFVQMFGCGM